MNALDSIACTWSVPVVSASLIAGCGGGSGSRPRHGLHFNSDCAAGLICSFGLCHAECAANGDCTGGGMCLKTTTTSDAGVPVTAYTCQPATEAHCVYNSNCTTPLVCGRDETCRNQCVTSVDCPPGQVCTSSAVCALSTELTPGTNDVPLVTHGPDGRWRDVREGSAGASGAAGATRRRGRFGRRRGCRIGRCGRDGRGRIAGAAGSGAAGSGAAGSTGKRRFNGRRAGASGTTCAACEPGKQCVAGACQPCGAVIPSLLREHGPCNSNLTCAAGICAAATRAKLAVGPPRAAASCLHGKRLCLRRIGAALLPGRQLLHRAARLRRPWPAVARLRATATTS